MIWFTLALLTALFSASQDTWIKHKFSGYQAHEMLAFPMFYSIPPLLVTVFFTILLSPIPPLDLTFWLCFVVSLPLNAVAFYLHIRAIQISPLGLTLPYLAFTPIFMIGTGFFLLDELPNSWGVAGVCIIVIGSYVLNVSPSDYTPLEPFKSFYREKGSRIMLLVSFLYSLAAVIGKKAILHSSVMLFTITFFLSLNILTLILMELFWKGTITKLLTKPFAGSVSGALIFFHIICHGWAVSMTKAVYMIAVKRMSILFGVVYGTILFSEKDVLYRLIGATLMIVGASLISLKGM